MKQVKATTLGIYNFSSDVRKHQQRREGVKGANIKLKNKINIKIPGARLEPLTLDRKMDVVQEYENKVSASE